jgi:two-component system, chemotaxis family, protein-glutamate methylesterase/glutaminase
MRPKASASLATLDPAQSLDASAAEPLLRNGKIQLRKFSPCIPRALFIGASTGGPQALASLLEPLAPHLTNLPVFVVLHVPADFTSLVTANISRVTQLETRAAQHGEQVRPGRIYFAPGDVHMRVLRMGETPVLVHSDGPPENFCKPAVDVLFRSAAQTFGPGALAVVLTGMGADGLAGSRAIAEAGGAVIAQDEASSVVWGMPGAVANAGMASAVLPLDRIAPTIAALMQGFKPGGQA